MLSAGAQYEFMQLTRNLDGPGSLQQGTFDYRFQFKNVDFDVDSYSGIALDLRFEVQAEMIYEGSVMNYTVKDTRIFMVRNGLNNNQVKEQPASESTQEASTEESKEASSTAVVNIIPNPRLKIDFCGFRANDKPC